MKWNRRRDLVRYLHISKGAQLHDSVTKLGLCNDEALRRLWSEVAGFSLQKYLRNIDAPLTERAI